MNITIQGKLEICGARKMTQKQRSIIIIDSLLVLAACALLGCALASEAVSPYWPFLLVFLILVCLFSAIDIGKTRRGKRESAPRNKDNPWDISALVLLNENSEAISYWDLTNVNGIVIGRSTDDAPVHVDLSATEYAAAISEQHTVLNRGADSWFVIDAGSANGTGLRRAGADQVLFLSSHMPAPVKPGDILVIGRDTMLAVR
jgi:hypothetical protein